MSLRKRSYLGEGDDTYQQRLAKAAEDQAKSLEQIAKELNKMRLKIQKK